MISPGTASLDFYFPKLEFNQTTTAAPALAFFKTSFSGSARLGGNDDFEYTRGPDTSFIDIDTFDDIDGSVGVFMSWFHNQTAFAVDAGNSSFAASGNPITQAELVIQYTIVAPTGTNMSASVYAASTNNSTAPTSFLEGHTIGATSQTLPNTPLTQYFEGAQALFTNPQIDSYAYVRNTEPAVGLNPATGDNYMTENGTTGRWEVTASFGGLSTQFQQYFSAPNYFGADESAYLVNGNNAAILYIKPFVIGEELTSFNYQIKDIRITPKFTYPSSAGFSVITGQTITDFGWTQTPAGTVNGIITNPSCQGTNPSTPTTNTLTIQNNASLRIPNTVDVAARLMKLSGSALSTNGNIAGAPQLITSSNAVTYTLNLGSSTISGTGGKGGSGTEVLDSYTEIVNFAPQSPILNILHPYHGNNGDGSTKWENANPANLGNGSTINEAGDIYYMEFSMSNFVQNQPNSVTTFNWNETADANVALPSVINTGSAILITQSVNGDFGGTDYVSASIYITKNTPSQTNPLGQVITNGPVFNSLELDAKGTASFSGSIDMQTFNYAMGDTFRMGISIEKTFNYGLDVGSYSLNIFNSSSRWSNPLPSVPAANIFKDPTPVTVIIPTFIGGNVLPFSLALDCQPLLNNFVNQRANPFIMDIDYNFQGNTIYFSSSLAPVNFLQILSGSALRAAVPESNYTEARSINPRYNGAKSTSQQLNVWNIGDTGTYGKNPTVELRDAFFGYFNDLDDPYPNINNLTRVNLNYLIDEQGNALPPSLNRLSIDTFEQVFPPTTLAKIAPKSGKNNFKVLGDPSTVERLMKYVTPIMYSQNAGNNYTNVIPLSGSGYISRYDNDDEEAQVFSGFNVNGECSVDTSLPLQSVDFILNPGAQLNGTPLPASISNPVGTDYSPYKAGTPNGGNSQVFYDESEYASTSAGEDLPNEQIVTVDASVVTSYISETRGVRDELIFEFHMYTGSIGGALNSGPNLSTETSFNLVDISCTVYTDDGRVTDIGSVLEYGWFQMKNIVNYEKVKKPYSVRGWRINRWGYTFVPVPSGGIVCSVDWEMYDTLFDLGLMRERRPSNGSGVLALEWNIKANSGVYTIKADDQIQWRFNGAFKNARGGYKQGLFFPLEFGGQYTSVNIQGVGALDHLLSEANTAQAPYWVFSGSSGTSSPTIVDQQFLVMSSSNMNEAYGEGFRQADLEYFPAPSPYFPGGIEPETTRFENIEYPLELKINDEIRFSNNENFTYKIIEVFSPQQNNITFDGRNRLKIKLDRPVDSSINKDFFLVRRNIVNPNSLYLNQPFPYESLASSSISTFITAPGSSGSFALTGSASLPSGSFDDGSYTGSLNSLELADTPGILYPDFPTDYLVQSASIIVNDLISKGVIES